MTDKLFTPPQEVGLVLAFVDEVIENSRELQGGRLMLVNREDVEDLRRARDLVRAELRSRQ